MPITSLTIIRKAADLWVFTDNETPPGKIRAKNAYGGGVDIDNVTIITQTGGIVYNSIPYSVIEYVDEIDPGNSFTPTSALQLFTYLKSVNFFSSNSGEGSAIALTGLIDALFSDYFGRGGQAVVIDDSELGFTTRDLGDADQDNIDITKYFKYTAADTQEDILAHINGISDPTILLGGPYTVNEKQSVWFIGRQVGAFPPKVIKYKMINAGKGTYGNIGNISGAEGTALSLSNIELMYSGSGTITDIENDPSTVIQDYGDIEGQTISEWLNELVIPIDIQSQEDGYTLFQGTVDGIETNYLWVGDAGTYGDGEAQSTMADFLLIEDVAPEPATPNLQSVTDAGSDTSNPITITGVTGKTDYLHNGTKFTDTGGNTVTIEQEAPIVPEVTYTVPAKDEDDTFAMVSDIAASAEEIQEDITDSQLPDIDFQYPLDYSFRPFRIIEQAGKFITSTVMDDLVKEKMANIQPFYVDYATGVNISTSGNYATPYKTIVYAFQQGAKLVILKKGVHEGGVWGTMNNSSYGSDDKFIVAEDSDNTYILNNTEGLSYSLSSGAMYSASVSGSTPGGLTSGFIDFKHRNAHGLPTRLTDESSSSEVLANPGSWYLDTGTDTLYVHTLDGRAPDSDLFSLTGYQSKAFSLAGSEYLYMKGVRFAGGVIGFSVSTVASAALLGNALIDNCGFMYANNDGFRVSNTGGLVWVNNSFSYDNIRDGFNYTQHETLTSLKIIETYCQGWHNGVRNTDFEGSQYNGSSAHNDITILRIGCKYWENVAPNINDVGNCRSLNIGVECFDSLGDVVSSTFVVKHGDFATSSGTSSSPSKMWLYACKSGDNNRSYSVPLYRDNDVELPDLSTITVMKSVNRAETFGGVLFEDFVTGDAVRFTFPSLRSYTAYDKNVTEWPETAYSQSLTWNGTAPSGTETKTWQATKVGKMVTLRVNLAFTTPGSGNSALQMPLPPELPTPKSITGFSATNDIALAGSGYYMTATSTAPPACRASLKKTGTGYSIRVEGASAAASAAIATIIYWTD